MQTPLLLVGDGPQEATGLGRIARDLGRLIVAEALPVDFVQVGGPIPPLWCEWRHLPMSIAERGDDWGATYIRELWRALWQDQPGVLFLVWDPARAFPYVTLDLPVQKWIYPAIDSCNRFGAISGPPAAVLETFDRVLAYGRWASEVIKSVRDTVPYLPHGITLDTYRPIEPDERRIVRAQLGPHLTDGMTLIGCVATNQARKDLALFFETLALLKTRGRPVYGWLHTDTLTRAWSIDQLVHDSGLGKHVTVTLGTLTDRELACLYQRCAITIAPGLGEGFGYPIVESLASGVPVVHGDFAGGAELVPKLEWRFPVRELRRESIYALSRPVFRVEDVANAVERALSWQETVGPEVAAAYCRGSVAHLDWTPLTPRWRSWLREGL